MSDHLPPEVVKLLPKDGVYFIASTPEQFDAGVTIACSFCGQRMTSAMTCPCRVGREYVGYVVSIPNPDWTAKEATK